MVHRTISIHLPGDDDGFRITLNLLEIISLELEIFSMKAEF